MRSGRACLEKPFFIILVTLKEEQICLAKSEKFYPAKNEFRFNKNELAKAVDL